MMYRKSRVSAHGWDEQRCSLWGPQGDCTGVDGTGMGVSESHVPDEFVQERACASKTR